MFPNIHKNINIKYHFYDSHDDIDWDNDDAYFIYYVVPRSLLIILFFIF